MGDHESTDLGSKRHGFVPAFMNWMALGKWFNLLRTLNPLCKTGKKYFFTYFPR